MFSNETYSQYIPILVRFKLISWDFVLMVKPYYIKNYQNSYVDAELYRELYVISKAELGKRNSKSWKDLEITMDNRIMKKLLNFLPI